MSVAYKINTSCFRYIIPFQYQDSFEDIYSLIENQLSEIKKKDETLPSEFRPDWVRRVETFDGRESDLYDYVKNEFKFENSKDILGDKKSGCEWLFWKSDDLKLNNGKKIKQLLYFPDGISKKMKELPDSLKVEISNLGIYCFRNGIGFIWYEMELTGSNKVVIDSDFILKFQNSIRELNRSQKSLLWEQMNQEPEQGIVLSEYNGVKQYLQPFSMGQWICNNVLGFLNISYMAGRKSAYRTMIQNSMKEVVSLVGHQLINSSELSSNVDEETDCMLADKAILFSYVSFNSENLTDSLLDRQILSYHLTNGYKESYHFSEETALEMKRPFDDVIWFATQEGVSYLAWPTNGKTADGKNTADNNEEVFKTMIPSKVKTDYFRLYIKTLYQSYSLLIYAEKIQKTISACSDKYLEEPLNENITKLFGEINLFLTKSMATSVSHIHHQSAFYIYLKQQLRIHEDVKSVTSGLTALDLLQREQRKREAKENAEIAEAAEKNRDNKLQLIMGLLTVLGISSAFVDCYTLFKIFTPESGEIWPLSSPWGILVVIAFIIIGILSALAIYFFATLIVGEFKKVIKNKQ